jgi:hypothetical protein
VKAKERRKLEKRRRRIARRLDRRNMPTGDGPVFRGANIVYEVSEKMTAAKAGGVAAAHVLARSVGLAEAIDRTLHLFKMHQPYHPKAGRCAASRTTC